MRYIIKFVKLKRLQKIGKINNILFYLTLFLIIITSFFAGVSYEKIYNGEGPDFTGCWRKVVTSHRSIAIKTDGREINKILNTARHEICHEIFWRIYKSNYSDYTREEKENFAINCRPEEYLDA